MSSSKCKKKVSFIITLLDSQEILDRQLTYYNVNGLIPDSWEVIIVDDDSSPPLKLPQGLDFDVKLIKGENPNKWTQNIARNLAARQANGEFFLMTDIDKVFTKSGIEAIKSFNGSRMDFIRTKGWLNRNSELSYGPSFLSKHGITDYNKPKRKIHSNSFLMSRNVYLDHMNGGYHEEYCGRNFYTNDDLEFNTRFATLVRDKKVAPSVVADLSTAPHVVCLCDRHPEYSRYFHDLIRDKRPKECLDFIKKINGCVLQNGTLVY